MKSFVAFLLLVGVAADAGPANPVSRIVTLLNGLKAKLEQDLDAETDLFATYKCWHKSTVETKKASNEAANTRVDSLKTYIKDIDAGKIEFTTEAADLAKQIAGLEKDLSEAKTMRESENKDFVAAEGEMKKGIAALKSAIKTIDEATKGSLFQKKSYLGMLSTRHSIKQAMELGRSLLAKDEVQYLDNLLNDDVPKADWKKLNRKATFKSKYKKGSGNILKVLGALQKTFEANLKDAQDKEADDLKAYNKLKASKGKMLASSQKAQTDMSVENGARGVSKTEAQDEVDALEDQVKADSKFIKEADEALVIKQKEWDARKELRGKEVLAMSQAIAVLASDDAKDQFKDSFKSQGYLLLQEASRTLREPERRAKCAARLIGSAAGDSSLVQIARTATGNAAIDKVIKKIDALVKSKNAEEKTDLEKKEKCESDLADAASKARMASLDIDTNTENIVRADQKVSELKAQIKEQEEKKKSLQGQIKDATTQRGRENEDFKADKISDEKAVALIEDAARIMKDWKNAKKSALIAQHVTKMLKPASFLQLKADPQYVVDAGSAPPPPPSTWEAGATYGGASGESAGIIGILDMVKEDVKKDIKAAVDEEAESLKDFNKMKADLEGEIKAVDNTVSALSKDKAAQEKTSVDQTTDRGTTKKELDGHMDLYNSYKPGCDFLLINFDIRTKARQTEVDGLQKAKAVLQGADFGGKSFLQVTC